VTRADQFAVAELPHVVLIKKDINGFDKRAWFARAAVQSNCAAYSTFW